MDLQDLLTGSIANKLLSTTILIVAALIVRTYVVHWIKNKEAFLPTFKRQWIVRVRNITIFMILGILVVVWLEQLHTIAASIVVIAAAIVIATKEFLLNVVGFFYRTTAKFVTVGDRIEVDGIRGDVIDQSLMGITLLEAARDVSASYLDQARKIMKTQALQQNLEEPNIEPRVQIQIVEPEKYNLVLRLPVPARKRARLEQDIAHRYLHFMESAGKDLREFNT